MVGTILLNRLKESLQPLGRPDLIPLTSFLPHRRTVSRYVHGLINRNVTKMYSGRFGSVVVGLCSWALFHRSTYAVQSPLCFQSGLKSSRLRPQVSRWESVASPHDEVGASADSQITQLPSSRIARIRCQNFAGVTGDNNGNLELDFEPSTDSVCNLVVVSGETGHGKSLLISKVVDLVTGGKASASLLHNPREGSAASVEIVLHLDSPDHIEMVVKGLDAFKVGSEAIFGDEVVLPVSLSLKRCLRYSSSPGKQQGRLQSACYINDQPVSLKVLKGIGAPFLPVVNAPLAASALGRAPARLAMIDAGVPSDLLVSVQQLTKRYNQRRKERKTLEHELTSRNLPASMTGSENNKDLELLQHWIDELNGFEKRILGLVASLTRGIPDGESGVGRILEEIVNLDWMDSDTTERGFSSALYRCLLELSEELKSMDQKIEAALQARDSLGSLSSKDSARTALERSRQLLFDAAGEATSTSSGKSVAMAATEMAHDLLNRIELALTECTDFLDDDDNGLLAVLQRERDSCSISSEGLWEYLLEWNTLARKHGMSPYLLPSCHSSLRQELDGNVEAQTLLPKARAAEEEALAMLKQECELLSQARSEVATRLSSSVSGRLPSLGMDSRFLVRIRQSEQPVYGSGLGIDEVDFFLYHDNLENSEKEPKETGSTKRGGRVETVASAGEKARILLAIECQVPGSIRALCGIVAPSLDDSSDDGIGNNRRPVAVIYDEIDAHVGGRASVSVSHMLSEQSEWCQVVAITHSASLAAAADLHICIQKLPPSQEGVSTISAHRVEGEKRIKELARMASGDMAMEEAEAFAEALIRDASLTRQELASSRSRK